MNVQGELLFCRGDQWSPADACGNGKSSGRIWNPPLQSPLGPLCEGAPPAGGGGENSTAARNISGYGKVLSLRPFRAPLPLWRKRHLPRIGGVCLAEGGQRVEKVHCRGGHWPPADACGNGKPSGRIWNPPLRRRGRCSSSTRKGSGCRKAGGRPMAAPTV